MTTAVKISALALIVSMVLSPPSKATVIDGVAATVNGQVITRLELEKAGQPLLLKTLLNTPDSDRPEMRRKVLLGVLDQLILKEIQMQRAITARLSVSGQEIDAAIDNIMKSGSLDEDMLQRALNEQGLTLAEYRQEISDQILFSKLMNREVRSKITVSDEEVEAYYGEHQNDYRRPERIRIRHLLIAVETGADENTVQEKRQEALAIIEEARQGADFSRLVIQHTPGADPDEDLLSGWLSHGEFVEELEEVAFALKEGEISEPVRTQAGFHLLQVAEKQEGMQRPIDDVRESIRLILTDGQTRDRYKEWLRELRDEAQVRIVY